MSLQMIAIRFIAADDVDDKLRWTIGRDDSTEQYPPFRYMNEENWVGFHLLPSNHKLRVAI